MRGKTHLRVRQVLRAGVEEGVKDEQGNRYRRILGSNLKYRMTDRKSYCFERFVGNASKDVEDGGRETKTVNRTQLARRTNDLEYPFHNSF
jgi:hypothetical protein